MTPADRLRIKLEAWGDRLWQNVPEIVFAAGVYFAILTILMLLV